VVLVVVAQQVVLLAVVPVLVVIGHQSQGKTLAVGHQPKVL
jgi:hypothetical protein